MNQGMYGIAGGQSGMARTVIFRSPRVVSGSTPATVATSFMNIPSSDFTPTAGVRTKVLGITGKGALTFVVIAPTAATVSAQTIELVLDGVIVSKLTMTTNSPSQGMYVVGAGRAATEISGVMEWVPFNASCEIYITQSVSVSSSLFASYELHQ